MNAYIPYFFHRYRKKDTQDWFTGLNIYPSYKTKRGMKTIAVSLDKSANPKAASDAARNFPEGGTGDSARRYASRAARVKSVASKSERYPIQVTASDWIGNASMK